MEKKSRPGAGAEAKSDLPLLLKGVESWNELRRAGEIKTPDLKRAAIRDLDLKLADLSDAVLCQAKIQWTSLQGADLSGADLRGAVLTSVDLTSAALTDANVSGAEMHHCTFARLDLSVVRGLDQVMHNGNSTIDTDTLELTAEGLADRPELRRQVEVFLRGCGVQEVWIEQMGYLIAHPIDLYSCFISYSHADKTFARRLHEGLQGEGVRCWRDEHDLVPGKDLKSEIDLAIRLRDKTLLICSTTSLSSWWVDNEVEMALQKEEQLTKQRGSKVLAIVPIVLDDALSKWQSGRASIIRSRAWADFTGWEKDPEKFDEELQRVVRAMKPGESRHPKPKL